MTDITKEQIERGLRLHSQNPDTFRARVTAYDAAHNLVAETSGATKHPSEPELALTIPLNRVMDMEWDTIEIVIERVKKP
jgi:hypothetical protein